MLLAGLQAVALAFGAAYTLWLFFLAVMALKRAKDAGTISPVALALGYPILLAGLAIDLAVNVLTIFVQLFLTRWLMRRYGIAPLLLLPALAILLGFSLLAASPLPSARPLTIATAVNSRW